MLRRLFYIYFAGVMLSFVLSWFFSPTLSVGDAALAAIIWPYGLYRYILA